MSSEDLSVRRKRVLLSFWRRRRDSAQTRDARLLFRRRYRSSADVGRPSTGRPPYRHLPSQGSNPSSNIHIKMKRPPIC